MRTYVDSSEDSQLLTWIDVPMAMSDDHLPKKNERKGVHGPYVMCAKRVCVPGMSISEDLLTDHPHPNATCLGLPQDCRSIDPPGTTPN